MIKNDTIKLPGGLKKKTKQSNHIPIFRLCYRSSTFHIDVFFLLFALIPSSYVNFWEELLIHETLFVTTKTLSSSFREFLSSHVICMWI